MKFLIILSLCFFILLSPIVFAQIDNSDVKDEFVQDMFYKGALFYELDTMYDAGSVIVTNITVENREITPIADAYLIVELSKGCKEPTYPTQYSDCDTIFFEKKIDGITLDIGGKKIIPFSYIIPSDISSGTYRMDVYFKTPLASIVGIPASFFEPIYKDFQITGTGSFPEVKFLRLRTHVAGAYSQSGPGVYPNVELPSLMSFKNDGNKDFSGTLEITMCSFDDTSCDEIVLNKNISVLIPANTQKDIEVDILSPKKPDAYSIRLELKDNLGRFEALYRSRIIVTGEMANIYKLVVDKLYYDSGDDGYLRVLVTGPYFPSTELVKNATMEVSIKDLDTGVLVFEEKSDLPGLDVGEDSRYSKTFDFSVTSILTHFEVCANTYLSDSTLYDNYCYVIDSSDLPAKIHKYNLDTNYDELSKKLDLNICLTDDVGIMTDASIDINFFVPEPFNLVGEKKIELFGCDTISYVVEKGDYLLTIQDNDNKEYVEFEVSVGLEEKQSFENLKGLGFVVILLFIFLLCFVYYKRRKLVVVGGE